jgi:hypothetical protein
MIYCRINLSKTNYTPMNDIVLFVQPPIDKLQKIYQQYCEYKKFPSVMPIFDSQFTDSKNTVIGYYDFNNRYSLVAFSILREYDSENVEALQFAWNYHDPEQRIGMRSLQSECAMYKLAGFKYLYLGLADEYKHQLDGYEELGPLQANTSL